MAHPLSMTPQPSARPAGPTAATRRLLAAAAMGIALASPSAHATLLNLDAFASGAFSTGTESGFVLAVESGTLLNSNRGGSGNLENDATAGAFAVLSLKRVDGGKFKFLGADFGFFSGTGTSAVFLSASLAGLEAYNMATSPFGSTFSTRASVQPTIEVDKVIFALGSGIADGTIEAIDNIEVVSVNTGTLPEPSALGLALLAVGLGAAVSRRAKAR